MQATYGNTTPNPSLSEGMNRGNNPQYQFAPDEFKFSRGAEYFVYLYTVNTTPQEFTVSRPPLLKEFKIKPCGKDKSFDLIMSLPHPLLTPRSNIDSGVVDIDQVDARKVLQDLCCPDRLTNDPKLQYSVLTVSSSAGTNDLSKRGIFWSYNSPENVTKEEVTLAKKAMEAYFDFLVNEMNTIQVSAPQNVAEYLTPSHHFAADYLNIGNVSWHQRFQKLENCEFCGNPLVNPNAKLHRTDGVLCWRGDIAYAVSVGALPRATAYDITGDPKYAPRTVPSEE